MTPGSRPRRSKPTPRPASEWAASQSEADFEAAVIRFAELHGWRIYHTWRSINSGAGFPDLTLARDDGRLVFAELKAARGKPTIEQVEWIRVLATVPGVTAEIWRPESWGRIEAVLGIPRGRSRRGSGGVAEG